MTQLERARENEVTPEMKFIAERENLSEDVVRSEVARGRMVIPAMPYISLSALSQWRLGSQP